MPTFYSHYSAIILLFLILINGSASAKINPAEIDQALANTDEKITAEVLSVNKAITEKGDYYLTHYTVTAKVRSVERSTSKLQTDDIIVFEYDGSMSKTDDGWIVGEPSAQGVNSGYEYTFYLNQDKPHHYIIPNNVYSYGIKPSTSHQIKTQSSETQTNSLSSLSIKSAILTNVVTAMVCLVIGATTAKMSQKKG